MSEQSARILAGEIRDELPDWRIHVRLVEQQDTETYGAIVFPVFLVNGRILATGIPRKDWLLAKLRTWERDQR